MRQTVLVSGVTLTREQIEQAAKELNRPEVEVPHLSLVVWGGGVRRAGPRRGVVIAGYAQCLYAKGLGAPYPIGGLTVVSEYGDGYTYGSPESLLRVWRLATAEEWERAGW